MIVLRIIIILCISFLIINTTIAIIDYYLVKILAKKVNNSNLFEGKFICPSKFNSFCLNLKPIQNLKSLIKVCQCIYYIQKGDWLE
jgi:hypothetical protein